MRGELVAPPSAPHPDRARLPAVALDGLSGVGKSTVGRGVADACGWAYLDTGASYRAMTVAALRAGAVAEGAVAVADPETVVACVSAALADLDLALDPQDPGVRLAGEDIAAEIRSARVTATVSAVSAVPGVRRLLVDWQRARALATTGIVCEGRDIGAVVLPDAAVKVWLTAAEDVRAARRSGDTHGGGELQAVRDAVARRDALDSGRRTDPARPAPEAVVLDTGAMTPDQVVAAVVDLVAAAGLTASGPPASGLPASGLPTAGLPR